MGKRIQGEVSWGETQLIKLKLQSLSRFPVYNIYNVYIQGQDKV